MDMNYFCKISHQFHIPIKSSQSRLIELSLTRRPSISIRRIIGRDIIGLKGPPSAVVAVLDGSYRQGCDGVSNHIPVIFV